MPPRRDFDAAFRTHYGIGFEEGIAILYAIAGTLTTGSRVDGRDLVHDFVLAKVIDGNPPVEAARNPEALARVALRHFLCDALRKLGLLPFPTADEPDGPSTTLDTDSILTLLCFWSVVDDPRFPWLYARAITLRLDRGTCAEVRTWEQVGDAMGCTRETAHRRFERGMDLFLEIFRHGWGEAR